MRSASGAGATIPHLEVAMLPVRLLVAAFSVSVLGLSASLSPASEPAAAASAAKAAHAACSAAGKAAAAAPGCSSHGAAGAAVRPARDACEACADATAFDGEIRAAAARVQVVRLKNGVIFVYTAEDPTRVRAIQAAMARRSQRWNTLLAAGDKARLCSDCKGMRGAMASAKLSREVVNIEGGVLTVMTTNDPALVARLHAMVEGPLSVRTRN
jgi:hypothetical protein